MKPIFRNAATALAGLLAASCSVGPDFVRPEPPVPEAYRAVQDQPSLPPPPTRWWTEFNSPRLNALVDEALVGNFDLRIAVQRIAQAEAQAGVAAGALLPDLQLAGSAQGRAPKGGFGSTSSTTDTERSDRTYQIGLQTSYELDLWGKNKSLMESALASAQASVYQRETVAMTLVSDVATAYFQYLQACERVQVAAANVENMNKVLGKVKRRRDLGEGSDLEVQAQMAMLAQSQAVLPILELSRDQQTNKLSLLLGRSANDLDLPCTPLAEVTAPEVRAGLPSELLLRRPDIRKAEADLAAANADINAARAKLYPSISLTAERGYGSKALIDMLNPASLFWNVAVALAQPIFDNGKTQAEIAYYEARWGELAETYRKSIYASLSDVEDALSAVRRYGDREEAAARRLAHAREARRLSERSYGIGILDYLTVLETERTQYNAEDEWVQSRHARLAAAVSLYKALGGGTVEAEAAPVPAEQPKETADAQR